MDTKSRSAMLAEKAQSSKSSLRESAFSHGSTPVWYKWQPTGPFVLLHLISNKQEQMRLSFTLEERNLTSAHKQPIDNWARIEERLELCEKVDPRLRWYWLCPNGFLLYFPYLEVGKLCKNYYCIVHSLSLMFEWQGWQPMTLLVSLWLAESSKGMSVTLGRETIKSQSNFHCS